MRGRGKRTSAFTREPKAGVFEDPFAFAGTNAFNIYRDDGRRIGRWEAPAGITDDELLAAFDQLLERHSEKPKLALVVGGIRGGTRRQSEARGQA